MVFENRVLKKTFGAKRPVTGDRSVWHNEELHNLHCPPNIRVAKSTRRRWAGHVAPIGDRSAYKVLVHTLGEETTWKT
jgi:hypothetical protein